MQEASGNDDSGHRVEDLVGERRDELTGHAPQVGAAVDADANEPHDREHVTRERRGVSGYSPMARMWEFESPRGHLIFSATYERLAGQR